MSYNISAFKLKKISMVLPADFDFNKYSTENTGRIVDFYPEILLTRDGKWSFNEDGEGLSMSGRVVKKKLVVENIHCTGEGSGNDWREIGEPLLLKMKADFNAIIIWEGGDEFERYVCKKGKCESQDLD